ncbi:hypothetical protein ACPXB3_22220 [Gordonia sp. DT219]
MESNAADVAAILSPCLDAPVDAVVDMLGEDVGNLAFKSAASGLC